MKRSLWIAAVLSIVLAGIGGILLRTSFVSFKHIGAPAKDAATVAIEASLPAKITFNENVGPILSANCYFCHGQDATARKADLRVDRPEFAFAPRKNGPPPIVQGHPETSVVMQRILSKDPNQVMPPPSTHKTLSPQEIALLNRWVQEGANYQEHWSFVKPERAAPPAVKQTNWVRNPIDNFVLAKLEKNHLAPEPEADRRTLIRRVTLDLTGLPPAPEEVTAFVDDKSPDAYEKVVDRLMANPHYGEHEARYWLDAARYAETVGLHFDEPTSIYPYRDYVIKSFNDNKPFDRFTVEQVAGDLLPNSTLEQKVATGFTRCGISTSEGGSIESEVLASYAKEYVEANSTVFMGLTMGCCACHDHKFDPITQKEFYQFSAFFRNTTQKGIGPRNAPAVPPFIRVPATEDEARWNVVSKQMDDAKAALANYIASTGLDKKTSGPVLLQKLAAYPAAPPASTDGLELHLPLREGAGNEIKSVQGVSYKLTGKPDWLANSLLGSAPTFDSTDYAELGNVGDFDTTDAFSYGCWVRVANYTASGAVFARMDRNDNYRGWDLYLDHGRPTVHLINFWPRNVIKQVAVKTLTAGTWQHVFVTYDGSSKAAGVKIYVDGELQAAKPEEDCLTESIRSTAQLTLGKRSGSEGAYPMFLQDLRVYHRVLSPQEINGLCEGEVMSVVRAVAPDKLTDAQRKWATNLLLKDDPKMVIPQQTINGLKVEYDALLAHSPATMVMDDKPTPAFAYVLKRGQYDQRGEKVEPGLPKVLPPMPPDAPKNRLGLAQWLVDPGNPLLSRVTVNRFWQQFFGVGIVRTSEDFGIMGERPVNQPLLDWLAVEFRESGWDVKHTLRLMVTSAAYRQSGRVTPQKREADPENRFVSRGPRFRMDAETIRDQALAVSGLLVPTVGGPSVKPYQPDGLWEVVSMTKEAYKRDSGAALFRRSMYTYLKRLAPNPQLTTFDTPSRELCTVRRDRTNTPLQALAVENDPQYVEAARHLALRAISATPDPTGRLDYMSERLLARPLDDREKGILLKSVARFSDAYAKKPDAAAQLIKVGETPANFKVPAPEQAAWTMVASQFLNLDETLNK